MFLVAATALVFGPQLLFADVGSKSEAPAPDAGIAEARPENEPAEADGELQATMVQQFSAPENLQVGEPLELTLEVTHPPDASVYLPDSFGNARWELADTERKTVSNETREITTLTLVFQLFRPGSTTLEAFDVTVVDALGRSTTLQTEPLEAKVISVLPPDETPPLESHRHPVAVWADDYTLAWAGGILGGALLAAMLTLLVMRRRDDEDLGPPPREAHVVAMEKLSALTTGDLLDQNEYMVFYVRMSEAVREYLGRRYGFRGTELTTTEILDKLEAVDWPAGLSHEDIREWLAHCDLVKFSGVIPERERAEQALRRGFSIVELTRPRPEPETDDEEPEPDDEEPEPDAEEPDAEEPAPEPETETETELEGGAQ